MLFEHEYKVYMERPLLVPEVTSEQTIAHFPKVYQAISISWRDFKPAQKVLPNVSHKLANIRGPLLYRFAQSQKKRPLPSFPAIKTKCVFDQFRPYPAKFAYMHTKNQTSRNRFHLSRSTLPSPLLDPHFTTSELLQHSLHLSSVGKLMGKSSGRKAVGTQSQLESVSDTPMRMN